MVIALVLLVPAAAVAATPAQRAASYLTKAQNKDGGFGSSAGGSSSQLFTGWAGLGLGSAGRNPWDVKRPGGRSLARYVIRGAGSLGDIGEIERTALLAKVAGLNPRSLGGRNLIAEIERRRRSNGSIAGFVSYTAFGVMALRAAEVPAGGWTIRWLVKSQNSDGGFGVARSSASDADMTGAVLQALATVGRGGGPAAQRAAGWLRANQNGDGGFGVSKSSASNAQSTAYAVQGLLAVGGGGQAVSRARSYLVRLQRGDGSIAFSSSSNQTPVWVTAQALMALEGEPLPLGTVARMERSRARASGSGGKNGGGAAAGGGGKAGSGGSKDRGGAAGGAGTAPGEAVAEGIAADPATGEPLPESEGTTAETLAQQAATQSATKAPEPVPLWAGILAAVGLVGLLWLLHRFVLPRRADLG
jgi:Squalene-hopene cyclase C-terminal domain/Prenyltransferase and squalene oxidase repeat